MSEKNLIDLLGEGDTDILLDELEQLLSGKTDSEVLEIKSLAIATIKGDASAGQDRQIALGLIRPNSIAVGLIIIGIGIMLL